MNEFKGDEPAFPATLTNTGSEAVKGFYGTRDVQPGMCAEYSGMSLRDYFAAKAMAIVPEKSCWNMKNSESDADYIARRSYEVADAMLKAREQT